MRIEAYILTWNESDIIRLVIKHYSKFCDKIVILDNHSTDGTDRIALELGCEVRKFGNKFFDDSENMKIKNECWKGSEADWVIVCDADEVLYLNSSDSPFEITFNRVLQVRDAGGTMFKTHGWQIMSDEMPKEDLIEITNGYTFHNYSKSIIFNPKAILEINYCPGAHKIDPVGNVVYSDETLYVLHYKHIGGVQRTIKRYAEYRKRMSKINRQKGWGIHYNQSPGRLMEEWNERMAKSKPLI